MSNPTTNATTLAELIEANRKHTGKLTYLEGEHDARDVSYAELYERAVGILHHLQRLGARRGDKLILFLGSNEQFIDAFWAALLGGIIPVPVALGISDEHRHKLLRIARKLDQPFIYTERRSLERIGAFAAQAGEEATFEGLRSRAFLVDDLTDIARAGQIHRAAPDDVAFIQFSSGSTSEPKGVVLTHRNIVANARGVIEAARISQDDVSLSWMPLTHDMGLIGFHLIMFYRRVHAHLMPTELFIRRPLLWLTLASRIRATVLCSPNFGYKHYLKVLDDRPIEGLDLDLSSVKLIFNGAEPISVELCEEFLTRLAAARLARNSMYPVYGLAEASLAVSFPPPGAPLRTIALNRHRLGVGSPVELIDKSSRDAVRLVSEGRAIPYCDVRIADDEDRPLPEGQIGNLHMRGENVTAWILRGSRGQRRRLHRATAGCAPATSRSSIRGSSTSPDGRRRSSSSTARTTTRTISRRSRSASTGLELGKVVAAGVRPPGAETEQLMLFILHRGSMEDFLPLATQAARLINEQTGLEVARGGAGQAHPEDHERQDPAPSARAELCRRRVRRGAEDAGGTA